MGKIENGSYKLPRIATFYRFRCFIDTKNIMCKFVFNIQITDQVISRQVPSKSHSPRSHELDLNS